MVSLVGFDPDQLRNAIPEADFVFSQVGSGVLNGEVATLPLESCVLVAGRYSQALTVRGKTGPTGFRVVAVLGPSEIIVNGTRARPGDLILHPLSLEVQAAFPPGFRWLSLAVHHPDRAGLTGVEELVSNGERMVRVLRPHYRKALAIRRAAAVLLTRLRENPHDWNDPVFQVETERDMTMLVRAAVGSAIPLEDGQPGIARQRQMVNRCAEFMMTHLRKPASLAELCRVAFASPRALEYGFNAIYDMSPMRYYRAQRYSAARRELLHNDKETSSVTEIARRYGFWHFGRFGMDYHTRFGERPSETLARPYHTHIRP
jgi:AraC family ethanolamine operon transcriptional activator